MNQIPIQMNYSIQYCVCFHIHSAWLLRNVFINKKISHFYCQSFSLQTSSLSLSWSWSQQSFLKDIFFELLTRRSLQPWRAAATSSLPFSYERLVVIQSRRPPPQTWLHSGGRSYRRQRRSGPICCRPTSWVWSSSRIANWTRCRLLLSL